MRWGGGRPARGPVPPPVGVLTSGCQGGGGGCQLPASPCTMTRASGGDPIPWGAGRDCPCGFPYCFAKAAGAEAFTSATGVSYAGADDTVLQDRLLWLGGQEQELPAGKQRACLMPNPKKPTEADESGCWGVKLDPRKFYYPGNTKDDPDLLALSACWKAVSMATWAAARSSAVSADEDARDGPGDGPMGTLEFFCGPHSRGGHPCLQCRVGTLADGTKTKGWTHCRIHAGHGGPTVPEVYVEMVKSLKSLAWTDLEEGPGSSDLELAAGRQTRSGAGRGRGRGRGGGRGGRRGEQRGGGEAERSEEPVQILFLLQRYVVKKGVEAQDIIFSLDEELVNEDVGVHQFLMEGSFTPLWKPELEAAVGTHAAEQIIHHLENPTLTETPRPAQGRPPPGDPLPGGVINLRASQDEAGLRLTKDGRVVNAGALERALANLVRASNGAATPAAAAGGGDGAALNNSEELVAVAVRMNYWARILPRHQLQAAYREAKQRLVANRGSMDSIFKPLSEGLEAARDTRRAAQRSETGGGRAQRPGRHGGPSSSRAAGEAGGVDVDVQRLLEAVQTLKDVNVEAVEAVEEAGKQMEKLGKDMQNKAADLKRKLQEILPAAAAPSGGAA